MDKIWEELENNYFKKTAFNNNNFISPDYIMYVHSKLPIHEKGISGDS
jgi:hypothetical protein